MTNLTQLLQDCADKLSLYYRRDSEYVGGVEHAELQRRIKAAITSIEHAPAAMAKENT